MKRFPRFNHVARICVVGVGGGGNNAVNRMIHDQIRNVEFIAVNTQTIALLQSEAPTRIQIGKNGQGTGGNVQIGQQAAQVAKPELRRVLRGADLVFITAGLGGGTGSGAAPVIAQIAKEQGALTIGVVTYPFAFEGKQRLNNANHGMELLSQHVDTLITIPNDRLFNVTEDKTPLRTAFHLADDVLRKAVQSITDVINSIGMINVDFADVRAVMSMGGAAMMASGVATGENRAQRAAEEVVNSNLLGISVDGAKGILLNVTAGRDQLSAAELQLASEIVRERADPEANFILGVVYNEKMGDSLQLTMIATGFPLMHKNRPTEEIVQEIENKVAPPPPLEETVPIRRVIMSRPKQRQRTDHTTPHGRFQHGQWGLPAHLRS